MEAYEKKIRLLSRASLGFFQKRRLKVGLHGTSLWNSKYKDIDLLAVSDRKTGIKDCIASIADLKKKYRAKVLGHRGNESIGLDYDIKIGKMILHLSYVVIL